MARSLHTGSTKLNDAAARKPLERHADAVGFDLELTEVSRFFTDHVAVDRCTFSVRRGEILALLGPSGCGKSTLLNLIAGFERPDAGEISLRGKDLKAVPAHRRNIAMVFQHYALFPHLTIARNIAYGLDARHTASATVKSRVEEMAVLLKLEGLEERYPGQLSGGQRQRVAIARALAIRPDVLLLDEAFSALDRNLREQTQVELSLLLRRLAVTTILVTHDQREAFVLADRIAVMKAGRIAQIGTPREMYRNPHNDYVLRFLGSTNTLPAEISTSSSGLARVSLGPGLAFEIESPPPGLSDKGQAVVHLRSEDIAISCSPSAIHQSDPAIVTLTTFLGALEQVVITLGDQQILIERPSSDPHQPELQPGAEVYLDFRADRCRLGSGE